MLIRHLGKSPAGVEWNVYQRSGESVDAFEARAKIGAERLELLHGRRAVKVVRVRELTPLQVERIEEAVGELREGWSFGRTSVEASRENLLGLAEDLPRWFDTEDFRLLVEGGSHKDLTEAQVAFGVRSMEKSLEGAVRKLLKAAR